MKRIIFLLLMSVCIDSLAAQQNKHIICNTKNADEASSFSLKPMLLLKTISFSPDWSQVRVNFRELYSHIDYSVWWDMKALSHENMDSLRVWEKLDKVVNQVDLTLKRDHIFKKKIEDKHFCFGLIKYINKRFPDCATKFISNALHKDAGLAEAWKWHMINYKGMIQLLLLNEKYVMSGHKTRNIQLHEDSDGFHTVVGENESYTIDLDWSYGSEEEHLNILELMLEEGSTKGIDLLFATGKFNIKDYVNFDKLLQINADARSILHLIEKYGLTI